MGQRTARDVILRAWVAYLTGQVRAEPKDLRWAREQLSLYEIRAPEKPRSPSGRRDRFRREAPRRNGARSGPLLPKPDPARDWARLREWLELYAAQLLGLNRSPATLEAYRGDLEQFFVFCEKEGLKPLELKRVHLLSHLAALAQQGYQASSRARKTHAIKGFFQFLVEGEVLSGNPFATIPSPRVEHRERRVLSEDEYQALRELARRRGARECMVVELLLQTGLRVSELCGLRLGDIRFGRNGQTGLVLVRQGKGKKDRVVPLNSVADQAVRAYVAEREDESSSAPLLVRRGRPLRRQGLNALLGRLFRQLGIRGASAHTLRHTFATHSLRKGVSLLVVKEVLGHTSLSTTERYLHLLRETMCRELEAHPL